MLSIHVCSAVLSPVCCCRRCADAELVDFWWIAALSSSPSSSPSSSFSSTRRVESMAQAFLRDFVDRNDLDVQWKDALVSFAGTSDGARRGVGACEFSRGHW